MSIWHAAKAGDLAEVKRLVGLDPGLLNAGDGPAFQKTPLMWASEKGHVGVRWTINEQDSVGRNAIWYACCCGRHPPVRLLLERGLIPRSSIAGARLA
jgi:ankyrin repeat protein